jgi:hypothetical protein
MSNVRPSNENQISGNSKLFTKSYFYEKKNVSPQASAQSIDCYEPKAIDCYEPKGEYIRLNVYDMTRKWGIYGAKCTCNV